MTVILNERGEIISSSIGKNRDGNTDVRLFKTQFLEDEDSQTVQQYQIAGFESRAPDGAKIIVADLGGGSYKISIAEDDGVLVDDLETGEAIAYSIDSGAIQAFIKFLKTGVLHINGDADFAVRFNELQTAFDQLKSDLNSFISVYNGHTQTVSGGVAAAPAAQGTPSTADITPAKVDTVKLPAAAP